jgi:SAM-dependent methyltransferase
MSAAAAAERAGRYGSPSWRGTLERVVRWSRSLEMQGDALLVDGTAVPVRGGVIRFRSSDDYNDSFGLQWNKYRQTQLDQHSNVALTRERFLRETGWRLDELATETILEAGSGAGRFTTLFGESGATLVTFDYSSAVDANFANNGHRPNIAFAQADILAMPFREGAFDRVFCHGVLQHTPDPAQAFAALARLVRPGGRLSVDIYHRDGRIRPWKSKYLWRWLTTRVRPAKLLAFLEWFIPKWLPLDTLIKRIPVAGNYLGAIVPCFNFYWTDLSPEKKVQWAILDTFDALAASYDLPATLDEVRAWFASAGFPGAEVREGGNGVVGNGVRA